jgi:nitroimidazol reductase NimA-like FMN-containing flavoprotein (pyridoxamine 5'-phosphate oxidase superfamily)
VRRLPDRARYDRDSINAIIDAALVGHLGWVLDGQPFVTPTAIWRQGDRLYWHGSRASRMLRAVDGADVCMTITLVDGLVLARSGFNHSVNYRSVMVLGTAHLVTDADEVDEALEAFIEHLYPGRWNQLRPMTARERKQTSVLWMDIREVSGKVRDDVGHDEPEDETWPVWAGVIPVWMAHGEPVPDATIADGVSEPSLGPPGGLPG